MLLYCVKCRKNTESKNLKVVNKKTPEELKNRRRILLPKSEVCDSNKSKFIKEQEATGRLSSLGTKIPLGKFPLVGLLLF